MRVNLMMGSESDWHLATSTKGEGNSPENFLRACWEGLCLFGEYVHGVCSRIMQAYKDREVTVFNDTKLEYRANMFSHPEC